MVHVTLSVEGKCAINKEIELTAKICVECLLSLSNTSQPHVINPLFNDAYMARNVSKIAIA